MHRIATNPPLAVMSIVFRILSSWWQLRYLSRSNLFVAIHFELLEILNQLGKMLYDCLQCVVQPDLERKEKPCRQVVCWFNGKTLYSHCLINGLLLLLHHDTMAQANQMSPSHSKLIVTSCAPQQVPVERWSVVLVVMFQLFKIHLIENKRSIYKPIFCR